MGVGQVKMPQKLLCLTEIQLLFLIKFCLDCSKYLVDFQSSEINSFYIKKNLFWRSSFSEVFTLPFYGNVIVIGF